MKSSVLSGSIAAVLLAMVLSACGSSSNSTSTSPTTPSSVSNATLISILGERGSGSFAPNPAPSGQQNLQWKNTDTETHHIVANDGSFDTGDIAPGATSSVVTMTSDGTNYHCTIHPTMIGSVNSSGSGAPPPCQGAYC